MSLYTDLGISPDATPEEIKAHFRTISKTLHPDVGGGAEEFARVSAAYDTLKDPEKRARYDATGETMARTPRGDAIAHIDHFLDEFLHNYQGDLRQIDLAEAIRRALRESLDTINIRLSAAEEKANAVDANIKIAQERFTTSGPDDVIQGMLRAKVTLSARGRQGIERLREEKKNFELALDMLKDYKFRADPMPQPQQSFTWTQRSGYAVGTFSNV